MLLLSGIGVEVASVSLVLKEPQSDAVELKSWMAISDLYCRLNVKFIHTIGLVLIASFSRVCKVLIRKLILLIAHPYVQFAQTQLFKFGMKLKRDKCNN